MPRTMKDYLKRKIVYKLYEKDIDELYHKEGMRTTALENENVSLQAQLELKADAQAFEG